MKNPADMPSYFERPDDKELFILANDGKYYIEAGLRQFPEHLHNGYTTEKLLSCDFSVVCPAEFGPRVFFTVRFEDEPVESQAKKELEEARDIDGHLLCEIFVELIKCLDVDAAVVTHKSYNATHVLMMAQQVKQRIDKLREDNWALKTSNQFLERSPKFGVDETLNELLHRCQNGECSCRFAANKIDLYIEDRHKEVFEDIEKCLLKKWNDDVYAEMRSELLNLITKLKNETL